MLLILLLLFIGIPLIEITLFIQVGGVIGAPATILIVILTAILGAFALRAQGVSTINNIRQTLDRGAFPATELRDAALLIIAAAFLLTPGFFTDAVGFALFIPGVRALIGKFLFARMIGQVRVKTARPGGHRPAPRGPITIDGTAEDISDPPAPSHRPGTPGDHR